MKTKKDDYRRTSKPYKHCRNCGDPAMKYKVKLDDKPEFIELCWGCHFAIMLQVMGKALLKTLRKKGEVPHVPKLRNALVRRS